MALGGGLGALARKVVPEAAAAALPYLVPGKADNIAKAGAKLALGGAVGGAATSLGENAVKAATGGKVSEDPLYDAGTAALTGGIAGPAAGAAVGAAGAALAGPWRYLAKKLDVDPGVLAQRIAQHEAETGQRASVASVMDMRDRGMLKSMAESRPEAGMAFVNAAREGAEDMGGAARTMIERNAAREGMGGVPRDVRAFQDARDAPANAFMEPLRNSGATVRISRDDAAMLGSAEAQQFIRQAERGLRGEFDDAARAFANPNVSSYNRMTVDDIDLMRRRLTSEIPRMAPDDARAAQGLADRLSDIVERQRPGYQASTVAGYGARNEAVEAAKAGQALNPDYLRTPGAATEGANAPAAYGEGALRRVYQDAGSGPASARKAVDELATSQNLNDALRHAYGTGTDDIRQGAQALRRGQAALEEIAPGRIVPTNPIGGEGKVAGDAGALVVSTFTGSKAGFINRILRAFPGGLSDRAAGRLADGLTSRNPAEVAATINALRRGGVADKIIRHLQAGAAAGAGANYNRPDTWSDTPATPLEITVQPQRRGG